MPKRSRSIKITDQKGRKPWLLRTGPYAYALNSRSKNRSFLIVCEGQTEEVYFKSFQVLTATIRPVHAGNSKTSLVNAVAKFRKGESYDEIWCVFDFDKDPLIRGQNEDFNRAIQEAHALGYHCAYSNDAFELWFVLHYQYLDQEQLRSFYFQTLGAKWGINYDQEGKSLRFARSIYNRLAEDPLADEQKAIQYAQKLLTLHKGKPCHLQNPVTTVFQLVQQLNSHCRK